MKKQVLALAFAMGFIGCGQEMDISLGGEHEAAHQGQEQHAAPAPTAPAPAATTPAPAPAADAPKAEEKKVDAPAAPKVEEKKAN